MPSQEKAVRFGLIGCGAWGSQHARAIAKTPGVRFAAVAEPSAQARAAAQTTHPDVTFYSDYRTMLEREKLDVVDLVLPPHLHFEATQAALNAGCHVLLEKPMCLRLDHCDELNALARRKKLHLAIGHEFRLSSLWGRIKEMVDEGRDRRPALLSDRAVAQPLPPGRRRLALQHQAGGQLDSGGADPLLRLGTLVLWQSRATRCRCLPVRATSATSIPSCRTTSAP